MNRRLISIVLALVLAAAGTLAVLAYVGRADERALSGTTAVSVLVAARPIPAGTAVEKLLPEGYLRSRNYPTGAVPDDAISQLTAAQKGLIIGGTVRQGALITASLMEQKTANQPFVIPDGRIAVTVQMGEAERVADYAKPGTKVVIFVSLHRSWTKKKGEEETVYNEHNVKVLMADVPVLAIGRPAVGAAKKEDSNALVTLGVTQEQAERLILGATQSSGGGSNGGNSLYMGLQTDSSELDPKSPGTSDIKLIK
jgi:pilus assembly protein CpaB